jgi:hypothetical protein
MTPNKSKKLSKLRFWLIKKLVGKHPVAANLKDFRFKHSTKATHHAFIWNCDGPEVELTDLLPGQWEDMTHEWEQKRGFFSHVDYTDRKRR